MPSPAATRTFICLELPETIRVQAEALQRRLAGLGDKIRWVNPRNLHLTLRFLGEISRSQVETVCLAVRCAASRVEVFPIRSFRNRLFSISAPAQSILDWSVRSIGFDSSV